MNLLGLCPCLDVPSSYSGPVWTGGLTVSFVKDLMTFFKKPLAKLPLKYALQVRLRVCYQLIVHACLYVCVLDCTLGASDFGDQQSASAYPVQGPKGYNDPLWRYSWPVSRPCQHL